MSKHPVLQMSKMRQQAWLDHAEPEDFFEMLTLLCRLYAKKIYTAKSGYKGTRLIEDYPAYLRGVAERKNYPNNVPYAMKSLAVPFASEGDAEGSYVEEPSADKATMDEINELIDNIEL